MRGMNSFDWELHEERIKQMLCSKAQNNRDAEAVFSIFEIIPNAQIKRGDIARFQQWMINKGFVLSIQVYGFNTYRCVVSDSLLEEQINKELLKA